MDTWLYSNVITTCSLSTGVTSSLWTQTVLRVQSLEPQSWTVHTETCSGNRLTFALLDLGIGTPSTANPHVHYDPGSGPEWSWSLTKLRLMQVRLQLPGSVGFVAVVTSTSHTALLVHRDHQKHEGHCEGFNLDSEDVDWYFWHFMLEKEMLITFRISVKSWFWLLVMTRFIIKVSTVILQYSGTFTVWRAETASFYYSSHETLMNLKKNTKRQTDSGQIWTWICVKITADLF